MASLVLTDSSQLTSDSQHLASGSRVANSDMPALAILKVSLWGYYLLVLVSSPIVKLFRVVLVPSHADKTYYDLLNKCLFPPKNDVMKRLRAIQEKAREHNKFASRAQHDKRVSQRRHRGGFD
uniref:Uncharacterized protein n=1 Tax=Timema douglasi TaxID=61478 RepID=A0A7R8ZAI2_TIMDO|nr:unnamed protein product [Timema douglasi]